MAQAFAVAAQPTQLLASGTAHWGPPALWMVFNMLIIFFMLVWLCFPMCDCLDFNSWEREDPGGQPPLTEGEPPVLLQQAEAALAPPRILFAPMHAHLIMPTNAPLVARTAAALATG